MNRNSSGIQFITIYTDKIGQRIDNFLRTYLKQVPKNMIYRILRKGEVRVNKKKVKPAYKLQYKDQLRIPPVLNSCIRPCSLSNNRTNKYALLKNKVLYEDDHLLILNKPSATAVHGGSGLDFSIIAGLRWLRKDIKFLELVHRLDRYTSGVLLLAKKRSALYALHEQLRAKKIQKDYLALVRGQWQSNIKTVKAPLFKNILANGKRIVRVNSKNGKPAETNFQIEEQFTLATLVRAIPITGRTHQIRVHARHVGHPIAFDNLYGDAEFDRKLKNCGLNRLFLHAVTLQFDHPNSGKKFQIEAPLDDFLCKCLLYLRNNHK